MNVDPFIVPIGVLTLGAAALFLGYGTWAGLVQRRILARAHGTYNTGPRAVLQGIVYVVIGVWFLIGGLLEIAAGVAAVEDGGQPSRPFPSRVLRAATARPQPFLTLHQRVAKSQWKASTSVARRSRECGGRCPRRSSPAPGWCRRDTRRQPGGRALRGA